jgi:hypothetical protein
MSIIELPDLVVAPKSLGSDLRISLLLRQGSVPFEIKPPGFNVTYRFTRLERLENGFYVMKVFVSFRKVNLDEKVNPLEFGERWSKWSKSDDLLNRKDYTLGKVQTAHRDDMEHMGFNLVRAVKNCPEYLTESRISELSSQFADMYTDMYGLNTLSKRPIAVCCQCNFHSDKPMKRCPCSKEIAFCSRECQRNHWTAGHRAEHANGI